MLLPTSLCMSPGLDRTRADACCTVSRAHTHPQLRSTDCYPGCLLPTCREAAQRQGVQLVTLNALSLPTPGHVYSKVLNAQGRAGGGVACADCGVACLPRCLQARPCVVLHTTHGSGGFRACPTAASRAAVGKNTFISFTPRDLVPSLLLTPLRPLHCLPAFNTAVCEKLTGQTASEPHHCVPQVSHPSINTQLRVKLTGHSASLSHPHPCHCYSCCSLILTLISFLLLQLWEKLTGHSASLSHPHPCHCYSCCSLTLTLISFLLLQLWEKLTGHSASLSHSHPCHCYSCCSLTHSLSLSSPSCCCSCGRS
jgi:hypothetical protein